MGAPFANGAVHRTSNVVCDREASLEMTGVPGGVSTGITGNEADEDALGPVALVALTVNV